MVKATVADDQIVQALQWLKNAVSAFAPNLDDPAVLAAWVPEFRGLDVDVVRQAFRHMKLTRKTFPSLAEALEACGRGHDGPERVRAEIARQVTAYLRHRTPMSVSAREAFDAAGGLAGFGHLDLSDAWADNAIRKVIDCLVDERGAVSQGRLPVGATLSLGPGCTEPQSPDPRDVQEARASREAINAVEDVMNQDARLEWIRRIKDRMTNREETCNGPHATAATAATAT